MWLGTAMLGGIALERRDTSECLQGCHTQFCHPGGHRKSPKPPPTGPRGQTRQRFFGNLQEAGTRHPPPRTVLVMGTTRQRRLREISMAMAHLQNENAGTGPPHPPHHPHLSHGQYGRHQPHSLHHSRTITTAPGQPPTQPPAPPPTPQPTEHRRPRRHHLFHHFRPSQPSIPPTPTRLIPSTFTTHPSSPTRDTGKEPRPWNSTAWASIPAPRVNHSASVRLSGFGCKMGLITPY